uniref:F-box domain-containing protein n=1 Tax=Graphocephala atropunctata TaxID=36148 RepID=A0A1B6MT40_9HEMI
MDPSGLLSLPVELIHHLSSFLAVEDVLSCSLTCQYLRAALNDNTVWKRYLPEPDLTRLESLEQHVQPAFHPEQILTPLCENWAHFLRKTHLLKNWRRGNVIDYGVKQSYCYADGRHNALKGRGQLIYQDRYLFLGRFRNDFESDAIEVWDIDKVPVLHSTFPIKDVNYHSFYLVGTSLVVVDCFIVNVHKINIPDKEYPLWFSFSITKEDVTFNQQHQHTGRHNERCIGWSHWTVDQYLVSNKCGENVFHIWDMLKACKVGSFFSPFDGFSISVHSYIKNQWILSQNVHFANGYYLLKFNFENKSFSDSVFKFDSYSQHIIVYNSHVIVFKNADKSNSEGWYDTVCTVHDFDTSVELRKRRFNNANKNYLLQSTAVVNGKFVILCFDCFQIIDALSLETVDHFQCDLNIKFIVHHFNLYGSVFVVTSNDKYILDMWDVTKKRKVPIKLRAVYTNPLCYDGTFTKLIFMMYSKIHVYRFW